MYEQILITILGIVATTATAIITRVLVPTLDRWLKAKTENTRLNSIIDDLMQTTGTTVDYINQTFVKQLKEDGKWNSKTQAQALQMAINEVRVNLLESTLVQLEEHQQDLVDVITRYVESAINKGVI